MYSLWRMGTKGIKNSLVKETAPPLYTQTLTKRDLLRPDTKLS